MLQTEFIKNLHNNYERMLLEEKPEEHRYQYCILNRGGIKGLLSCSLRYINGASYLYYDITSKQNVAQLFQKRKITRGWMKDFLWSFNQIQLELGRFLLDEDNILWYPEQIFQDLEDNIFAFLYVPYYEGDNGCAQFMEFLVEHIDYSDEVLVECVYHIYEQFEQNGMAYLRQHIFADAKVLETDLPMKEKAAWGGETERQPVEEQIGEKTVEGKWAGEFQVDSTLTDGKRNLQEMATEKSEKKGIFSFLQNKKRKNKEQREHYRQTLQLSMEGAAVAEEFTYDEEEYGRTIYVEEPQEEKEIIHRLYSPDGKILAQLGSEIFTIGKKKGEADLVLEDLSISRIHARITREEEEYFLEDMNSTNGTFKNGLRLQPYEKRKLQQEDEIQLGKVSLIFR